MPQDRRFGWVGIVAVSVTAVALGLFFVVRRQGDELRVKQPEEAVPARQQTTTIGGVRRPLTDIQPRPRTEPGATAGAEGSTDAPFDYGTAPLVPKDANEYVKSVVEALETGTHPERVSSLITPAPFDPVAYQADPKKYITTVEPGRVWQSAQPGPGVPRLEARSARFVEIEQGESVTFKVHAAPGAPVTFTSFDLGEFENRLTSMTVQADGEGNAQVRFTGTPGTINNVNILAASPVTSGQLRYVVNVTRPRTSPVRATE